MVHICKPISDIEADFKDSIRANHRIVFDAKEQAILELQCSYGLPRHEALTRIAVWAIELGDEMLGYEKTREVIHEAYAKAAANS